MNTNGKSVLKKVGIALGAIVALVFLLIITLGAAIDYGFVADVEALPAGKIHPRYLKKLREMEVIDYDERVLYFYSGSFLSIKTDGNLFTEDRVISYKGYDDEVELYSATYDEIVAIDFEPATSWEEDSNITVKLRDGSWFTLTLTTESDGDKKFYRKLLDIWKRKQEREG
ncbi:MAG: hypothetical protein PVH49_13740 [Syntrophobacterales bacterium]|jgi:hypothetical protein